ncbi:hypothetical protein [Planctopirus hydrillae]|nr:hypothetical protein [Planctopirus hydrillae]
MSIPSPFVLTSQLILARLLVPQAKAPTPAALAKSLAPLFNQQYSSGEWRLLFDEVLSSIRVAQHVEVSKLILTPSGLTTAREFCGFSSEEALPKNLRWKQLLDKHITPRLCGFPPPGPKTKLADHLLIEFLKQSHQLAGPITSLSQLLVALAWKELGIDSRKKFTPASVLAKVSLKTDRTLTTVPLAKLLSQQLLGDSGKDFAQSLIRQKIRQAATTPSSDVPTALPNLTLADVHAALPHIPAGPLGPNRIFIRDLWQHLLPDRRGTLEQFRLALLALHKSQHVRLVRADLTDRLDPRAVEESRIEDGQATYHLLVREDKPPATP